MALRQEQKDYLKRSVKRFPQTIAAAVLVVVVSIVMGIANSSMRGTLHDNEIAIGEVVAKVNLAKQNYIQEDIPTNTDNVFYDTQRCKDDDAKLFAELKPILSYDNADSYNIDRQNLVKATDSTALSTLFPKLDYTEIVDYRNEENYKGKIVEMYKSEPKNFKSYLTGISGDIYTYTAIITVSLSEPNNSGHTDCVVITYSTKSAGEVDYSTLDGMRCTDVRV